MSSVSVDLFAATSSLAHTDVRVSFTSAQLLALQAVSPIMALVRDETGVSLRSARAVRSTGLLHIEPGVIVQVGPGDDPSVPFDDPIDIEDLFGPLDERGMPNILFHIRDETLRFTPYFATAPAPGTGRSARPASSRRARQVRRAAPSASRPLDITLFD
jgi:hypothetical protein